MAELFEVAELVKIGVEDEKTGVALYTALAKKAADPQLRKVFADLVDQERYHQKRFEEMLAKMGGLSPREQYPGEYMTYLRTLTDERAFPDQQTALRMAKQSADDAAAVAMASRFERDTLLLMNELRGMVRDKDRITVDELIREEQSHLVTLAEAKAKLK